MMILTMTNPLPLRTLGQLAAILLLAGCVSTPPSAPPTEPLIADSIGLVTPEISAMLNQQAQSGVNSAIRVVGQQVLRARGVQRGFNSSYAAANFAIPEPLLGRYNSGLSQALAASAYGGAGHSASNGELAFYSLLSWQPLDEEHAMLELVLAASDWPQTQALAKAQAGSAKRTGQAFVESTLWFALHRKQVPRAMLAGSAEELLPLLLEMAGQSVRLLPQPAGP